MVKQLITPFLLVNSSSHKLNCSKMVDKLLFMFFVMFILCTSCIYCKPAASFNRYSSPITSSTRWSLKGHCCDRERETTFVNETKLKMRQTLEMLTLPHRELMTDSLKMFTDQIHKLIISSHNATDQTLAQSYPHFEKVRKQSTAQLFDSITRYIFSNESSSQHLPLTTIAIHPIEIARSVDKFFVDILDDIYNSGHLFTSNSRTRSVSDSNTINCLQDAKRDISDHFGNYPSKISKQLRKALQVARAIIQSSQLGLSVFNFTASVTPSESCINAFVRMTACPLCKGIREFQYCPEYCTNVARGCLAQLYELHEPWISFVTSLEDLSTQMIKDYNLETVLVEMSDNIDNAISLGLESRRKLLQDCSTSSRRSARQVNQPDHHYQHHHPSNSHSLSVNKQVSSDPRSFTKDVAAKSTSTHSSYKPSTKSLVDSISMEVITKKSSSQLQHSSFSTSSSKPHASLSSNSKKRHRRRAHYPKAFYVNVGDFVHQLGESKKFFMAISDQICANSKHNKDLDKCWNGTSFSPYSKSIVDRGVHDQQNNPEVEPLYLSENFKLIIGKLQSLTVTIYNSVRRLPEVDLPSHNDPVNRNPLHDVPSDDEDFENPNLEGSGGSEDDETNYHDDDSEDKEDHLDDLDDSDDDGDESDDDEGDISNEDKSVGRTPSHPGNDHPGVSIAVVIPGGNIKGKGKSASSSIKSNPVSSIMVTCLLLMYMVKR